MYNRRNCTYCTSIDREMNALHCIMHTEHGQLLYSQPVESSLYNPTNSLRNDDDTIKLEGE